MRYTLSLPVTFFLLVGSNLAAPIALTTDSVPYNQWLARVAAAAAEKTSANVLLTKEQHQKEFEQLFRLYRQFGDPGHYNYGNNPLGGSIFDHSTPVAPMPGPAPIPDDVTLMIPPADLSYAAFLDHLTSSTAADSAFFSKYPPVFPGSGVGSPIKPRPDMDPLDVYSASHSGAQAYIVTGDHPSGGTTSSPGGSKGIVVGDHPQSSDSPPPSTTDGSAAGNISSSDSPPSPVVDDTTVVADKPSSDSPSSNSSTRPKSIVAGDHPQSNDTPSSSNSDNKVTSGDNSSSGSTSSSIVENVSSDSSGSTSESKSVTITNVDGVKTTKSTTTTSS